MIKAYVQGKAPRKDRQLFGQTGHLLTSKAVHAELGAPITALPGDLWSLMVTDTSDVRGFATARAMKNNTLHLRFVYTVNGSKRTNKTLINHVTREARAAGHSAVYTTDKKTSSTWRECGFTAQPGGRGAYCRWHKPLKRGKSA